MPLTSWRCRSVIESRSTKVHVEADVVALDENVRLTGRVRVGAVVLDALEGAEAVDVGLGRPARLPGRGRRARGGSMTKRRRDTGEEGAAAERRERPAAGKRSVHRGLYIVGTSDRSVVSSTRSRRAPSSR
jgi:hypothetical protein